VWSLGGTAGRNCIVSDICPAMLEIARRRAGGLAGDMRFSVLDAHGLIEIAGESVNLYAMSLGMKICDRSRALAEAWRVLKPGGTFICLEASEIPVRLVHRLYLAYMNLCMPVVGYVATGGDASAYHYLLSGVRGFPGAEAFAEEIWGLRTSPMSDCHLALSRFTRRGNRLREPRAEFRLRLTPSCRAGSWPSRRPPSSRVHWRRSCISRPAG
jgi:SAM-dependent methyltransferase